MLSSTELPPSQHSESARVAMQGAASKAKEELAQEAAEDADVEDPIQATPAELPDHAYIRTQATGAAHCMQHTFMAYREAHVPM